VIEGATVDVGLLGLGVDCVGIAPPFRRKMLLVGGVHTDKGHIRRLYCIMR